MQFKKGDQIFPTRHPFKDNKNKSVSNVKMGSFGFEEGTRVIPTMVDGVELGTVQALQRAREEGLEKYPLFKTKKEAEDWINLHHQSVDANGRYIGQQ